MSGRPATNRSNSNESRKYMVVRSDPVEFEQVPIPRRIPVPPTPIGSLPQPGQPSRQPSRQASRQSSQHSSRHRQDGQTESSGQHSAPHSRQSSTARTHYTARSRAGSVNSSREHSCAPSRAPSGHRSRTHTAGSSSDGSASSESEFLIYRDGEDQPLVRGHQYGPYSYLNYPQNMARERQHSQDSLKYAELASTSSQGQGLTQLQQFSAPAMYPGTSSGSNSSNSSTRIIQPFATSAARPPMRHYSSAAPSSSGHNSLDVINQAHYAPNQALETHFLYDDKDPEHDDYIHNPSHHDSILDSGSCSILNIRGICNVLTLIVIIAALIGVFVIYPIINQISIQKMSYLGGFGLGGTNASGQVPDIPGLRGLVDSDTPKSAYSRQGFDGHKYDLVFSDEFNTDGRTFWPGDDPYFTAHDGHYHATGDLEWYDAEAITTEDGYLTITISKEQIHDLDYKSGMLQSWNQLCFTGGYIEVSVSLPGSPQTTGFWPGIWTLGNLARAGYGSTTEGVWPYTYDACDVGTLQNQTLEGEPTASEGLSYQPGQKLSACTCKGEDHPGPNSGTGRGGPEIDVLEAQSAVVNGLRRGQVSQSAQIAPYDDKYHWKQSSGATTIYDEDVTMFNTYIGGTLQEAVSGVTYLHDDGYELNEGFRKYGFEYRPGGDADAFITWTYDDKPTWQVTSATFPADPVTQVSQRLISQEPMSIIMNLGMSSSFQTLDLANLPFPSKMRVDYVRIYQREGEINLTCDPDDFPTAKYINDHLEAYDNANRTTWEEAGYEYPKNKLVDDC